jgi:putative ABC transport system permease protein
VKAGILNLKVLRDLKAQRWQFGAVALVILLGVAMYVGPYTAYLAVDSAVDRYFTDYKMADMWVTVDKVSQAAVRDLEALPGVSSLGRVNGDVLLDMGGLTGEKVAGRVISMPPWGQPPVSDISILKGTYFTPNWSRELLVEKRFADYHQVQPGDWLTLVVDGNRTRYQVAGIATGPEFMYVIRSAQEVFTTPRTFGVFFMPEPSAARLFSLEGMANEIALSVEPGTDPELVKLEVGRVMRDHGIARLGSKEDNRRLADRRSELLEGARVGYLTELKDQFVKKSIEQDLANFRQLGFLFPLLFLSIASLTTYILLNRLIESQRVQIGLLRGLGYGRTAILRHYLAFALVVGLIGSVLGVVLGMVMGDGLSGLYAEQLNVPPAHFRPYWDTLLSGILIGTLVPVAAGLLPAWAAIKLRPSEAMHPAPPATGRRSWLEWVLPFLSHLPYVMRLPLRNTTRKVRQTTFMIIGIASAVTLTIVSLSFYDSFNAALYHMFDVQQQYDGIIKFRGRTSLTSASYVRLQEGVTGAEPVLEMSYRVRFGNAKADIGLMGLTEEGNMLHLVDTLGNQLKVSPGSILLPIYLERKLGAAPGDTLTLESLSGAQSERTTRLAGYVDTFMGGSAYVTLRDLQDYQNAPGAATSILATFKGRPSPDLMKRLYNMPGVSSVELEADARAYIDEQVGFLLTFIWVMLAMGTTLGAAIIFNSVTVNVLQRTRELALMRVVGMGQKWIGTILTLENLAVGMVGIAVGMPAGYFVARAFMNTIGSTSEDSFSIPFNVTVTTYVIAGLLAVAILMLSQLPALRRIRRMSLTTSLKDWYE